MSVDVRQIGRFLLVAAVLSAGAAFAVVVSLVPGARRRRAIAQRGVARVARGVLRALDVSLVHRGPTPRGAAVACTAMYTAGSRGAVPAGALMLANHMSWLDIVAALASWRCTFVAKREVGTWPVIGTLARTLGVVFVDRSRKRDLLRAIPALERALRAGECVMLFPEGTTTDGTHVLRFRSALVEAAVRADVAVFPLAICGEVTESASAVRTTAICWCDDETLVDNVWRLAGTRAPSLTLYVGAPIDGSGGRKQCTRRAWEDVVRRFQPVRVRDALGRETGSVRPASSSFTAGLLTSAAD